MLLPTGGTTVKRYFGLIYAPLCIALLLGGCLTQANQEADATRLVEQMHSAIQAQNLDAAMELYGDDFFASQTRQAWREKLASLPQRFGELREIKSIFSQKNPRLGGDFYVSGYKLIFERGVVHETLTIFKKNGEERLMVTGQLFKFKDDVL
jgi:hypothetical protein